jgi:hypothetical protein
MAGLGKQTPALAATLRLSDNLSLHGRAAWGRSSNEVSPFPTYTDSFETTRWLATASLIGGWHFGGLQVQPSATISFIEEKYRRPMSTASVSQSQG